MNVQSSRLDETKSKITNVLKTLNKSEMGTYEITNWPDEENRSTRDCDAIAKDKEGRALAIEHTRIETFENQALDSRRFVETFEPIIPEIENHFKCKICITLPTFALSPGQNWKGIARILQSYLIENLEAVPWGISRHENIHGIPFHFEVDRNEDRSGLVRWAPRVNRVEELAKRIKSTLEKKKGQLARYKQQGFRTMLILESEDIALVGHIEVYKAFLLASEFTHVEPFDCVWFIRIWESEFLYNLCIHGPKALMEQVNPPNFGIVPDKIENWRRLIESEFNEFPD